MKLIATQPPKASGSQPAVRCFTFRAFRAAAGGHFFGGDPSAPCGESCAGETWPFRKVNLNKP